MVGDSTDKKKRKDTKKAEELVPAIVEDKDDDDFLVMDMDDEDCFVPLIEDLEPLCLEQFTPLENTVVTPQPGDRVTIDVDFMFNASPSKDEDDDVAMLDLPECGHQDDLSVHSHTSGSDDRFKKLDEFDPRRQGAVRYYRALNKLATSMRQSEETRAEIIHQRRLLPEVYGTLKKETSLLSGLGFGACLDYEESRTWLMSYICGAILEPPPTGFRERSKRRTAV